MKIDTNNAIYLGSFAVDSGQAIVGDPCYLDEWKPWNSNQDNFDDHFNKAGEYSYLGACNATLTEGYGELGISRAIAFTTGYGDGLYSVYGIKNEDDRFTKIIIDFEGDMQ